MITFVAVMMVLAAIGLVAWPLIRGNIGMNGPSLVEDSEVSEILAQKDATLFAISELQSDHEMGNLSKGDYQELRRKYEEKAVALIKTADELRSERGLGVNQIEDEIEARVSSLRGATESAELEVESRVARLRAESSTTALPAGRPCPGCRALVRPGDSFCPRCGKPQIVRCPGCSAEVDADGRFCPKCGVALAMGGDA